MGKRFVTILIIVFILFSFTGCWSRREIEKLAMATIIGTDKVTIDGQDKWLISANMIKPRDLASQGPLGGNGSGSDKPTVLVSSIGATAWEAGRNLAARLPRREYISHANIFVIGERLARDGVDQIIDVILRSKDIRLNTWVLVAKGQALDILETEPEFEELLSQEVMGIVQNQPVASKVFTIDIKRFANQLITPGQDAVASCIEIFERKEEGQSQPGNSSDKGNGQKAVRLGGTAVFRKGKLAGWLNDEETKGYLYGIGRARQGIISLSVHELDKKDVAFAMTRASSRIVPRVEGDEISFIIDIKAEGDLQQHDDTRPIARPDVIKAVEQKAAHEIKALVENALNKAQNEFEADIFGFGNRLHKRYPQFWKQIQQDWREIYPDIKVTVNVEAKVRRTGMITDTPAVN
ncbi:Ger(x)C family spore germination protein [Tepidanaerobacter sp. GT38]|uniref:Ger(x)C family spore germination protein n=1 Tax=Tepidanaerobacter sp. GT38 TaxID=2722793 RepID=UPI001F3C8552|nr:Ger(x)C family spore germination protein [Tepidanaerobacter sp. GT38]